MTKLYIRQLQAVIVVQTFLQERSRSKRDCRQRLPWAAATPSNS